VPVSAVGEEAQVVVFPDLRQALSGHVVLLPHVPARQLQDLHEDRGA
jgi:diadenosine tetraphosphate (Ap4A) HIT family hydrolase